MYVATDRLVLRDFRLQDADAVHAFASDPAVHAWTRWDVATWEQTVDFVERARSGGGPQYLAVCLRGSEEPIGAIGAGPSDHSALEPGAVELSWAIRRDMWGRGISTEAVGVLLEELFIEPHVTKVVAFCHPENIAAQRVLGKAGMVLEARHDIAPLPVAADVFSDQGVGYRDLEPAVSDVPLATALRFARTRVGARAQFVPMP